MPRHAGDAVIFMTTRILAYSSSRRAATSPRVGASPRPQRGPGGLPGTSLRWRRRRSPWPPQELAAVSRVRCCGGSSFPTVFASGRVCLRLFSASARRSRRPYSPGGQQACPRGLGVLLQGGAHRLRSSPVSGESKNVGQAVVFSPNGSSAVRQWKCRGGAESCTSGHAAEHPTAPTWSPSCTMTHRLQVRYMASLLPPMSDTWLRGRT